jgi:thioredoxin reductase-like selenoprotein T
MYGRGMKNYFLQVKAYVENTYDDVPWTIEGLNYPPSDINRFLASLCSTIWMIGIVLVLGGSTIFKSFGMAEPEFMTFVNNNKMMVFFGLFMCNSMGNNLLATGAFEIYVDNQLMFSKLQTGRLPGAEDIAMIVSRYLKR